MLSTWAPPSHWQLPVEFLASSNSSPHRRHNINARAFGFFAVLFPLFFFAFGWPAIESDDDRVSRFFPFSCCPILLGVNFIPVVDPLFRFKINFDFAYMLWDQIESSFKVM
jgi:fumarate reductase subunit C